MTSAPFPVLTLRAQDSASAEPMGSKRKEWYQVEGQPRPWLFKFSRFSDGAVVGEHWSEKLACEIAALLHLPHAQVELASLDGAVGSLSERFPILDLSNAELVHGNDLLGDHLAHYDREQWHGQREHTVVNIRAAIQRAIHQTYAWPLEVNADDSVENMVYSQEFAKMRAKREVESQVDADHALAGILMLDALILNTDRHHENWGMVRYSDEEGEGCIMLAPSFDHASSLARNVTEAQCAAWLTDRSLDRVAWYASRAKGAVWLNANDRHGPSPLALVVALYQDQPTWFRPWLERLRTIDPAQIVELVQRIPDDMIGHATRDFVSALVRHTFATLAALP